MKTITRFIAATVSAIFLSATPYCLSAQTTLTPVQQRCTKHSMKHQGRQREFYLYMPEGLPEGAPVVIGLHGYTGKAENMLPGLLDAADRHGFAVCYPQGLPDPVGKPSWNVGYPSQKGMKVNDIDFMKKLIRHLSSKFGLSRENAFLTGMSNGGEMCYLMSRKSPGTFRAIASIAGLTLADMLSVKYRKPIPFMEVHGTEDRTSEWTGDPENKGGWGAYLAVPASISCVVAANGCVGETITRLPLRKGHNQVILHHFQNGKPAYKGGPSADVLLYEVIGGDHTWADEDMDTCEAMWDFFSTYLVR
jgi:polyhydroxybutyrate depolymerase